MTYTNQTTSSIADLITKIGAFLVADGWTQDQLVTGSGKSAWHKSTVYVSVRWDTTAGSLYLGVYHALGYTGGNDPGNHPNDSGNGQVSGTDSTLATGRRCLVGDAPLQFWGFSDPTVPYAHFVVQQLANRYTHLGFGKLDKIGDWTGGEYCWGHRQQFSISTAPAVLAGSSMLLDGLSLSGATSQPSDMELYVATVHAEGLPNEGGTSKWAICMSPSQPSGTGAGQLGVDRASVARIHFLGGFRAGIVATPFGNFSGASTDGHVPQYPIMVAYFNRTTDNVTPMGFVKDVRGMSIQSFSPGDTLKRGSTSWMVFPSGEKWISGSYANTTSYQGIAYRVVP